MEEARSPKEHSTSTSGRRLSYSNLLDHPNVLKTRKLWKVTVTEVIRRYQFEDFIRFVFNDIT
jgi:hypothetical protein